VSDRENENGCGYVREDLLFRENESVNGTSCLPRDCGGAMTLDVSKVEIN
jgi:hypothetical protein